MNNKSSADDFIFIEQEIGGDNGWKKFVNWLRKSFSPNTENKGLLSFFSNLFAYLFSRTRIILVLMSILADIIFRYFEGAKDSLVRKSFWGRGGFLIYAGQIVLTGIAIIVIVSALYRNPAITNANEDNQDYIGVVEDDLMVMNASLNTLIPQDRGRLSSEEYVVKRGDTISSIAKSYGLNVNTILWANDLDEDDYISLGQTLTIPPQDGVIVTIAKNDTVESLAKKYSANAADIVDWNWLDSSSTLIAGEELFIPNGEEPVKVTATKSTSYSYTSSTISYTSTYVDPNVGKFLGVPLGGPWALSRGFYTGHYGMDFYPTSGQPSVIAACSGTVISSGWGTGIYYGYGYYAHIDCGNGYTTLYGHMQRLYISTGQSVSKGQALGLVGQTGVAYGIHVHFELRRGSSLSGRMNPAPYISY